MFDIDVFIDACQRAAREHDPKLAIGDVVAEAVSRPAEVAAALPPDRVGVEQLHVSPDVTITKFVWAPGMTLGPHDHGTWAAIGLYTGGEDNAFFRRRAHTLAPVGHRRLHAGDACVLSDDVIHAVTNPTQELAGALHVYGGDLFSLPRSQWRGTPVREEPYDVEQTRALFEAANASLGAGRAPASSSR